MNRPPLSRLIFPLDQLLEELDLINLRQLQLKQNSPQNLSEIEFFIKEVTKIFEKVPEELLSEHYLESNPEINFKKIVECRLAGNSWRSLSEKFRISDSRLRIFWYSCVKKLSPQLKEYLSQEKLSSDRPERL